MAFEGLSERLENSFKKLRAKGKLTESDVKEAMREVRMALLEADVNYKVAKEFTAKVTHVADAYAVVEPFNADVWDWDCDVQICFEDMDDLKKVSEGKTVTIVGECYGQADMYTAKICRAIVKK